MPDLEVNLRVRERVLLRNLLPKEGDLSTIRIVRELRNSLEFTEDDLGRLNIGAPCQVCGERAGKHGEYDKEDESTHPFIPSHDRIGWDQDCIHCSGIEKGHDDSEHVFASKDAPVGFTLGPAAVKLVKGTLAELSQHKKMTEEFLDLYDAFHPEPSSNGAKPIPMKKQRSVK